jgi:hypothetical protein
MSASSDSVFLLNTDTKAKQLNAYYLDFMPVKNTDGSVQLFYSCHQSNDANTARFSIKGALIEESVKLIKNFPLFYNNGSFAVNENNGVDFFYVYNSNLKKRNYPDFNFYDYTETTVELPKDCQAKEINNKILMLTNNKNNPNKQIKPKSLFSFISEDGNLSELFSGETDLLVDYLKVDNGFFLLSKINDSLEVAYYNKNGNEIKAVKLNRFHLFYNAFSADNELIIFGFSAFDNSSLKLSMYRIYLKNGVLKQEEYYFDTSDALKKEIIYHNNRFYQISYKKSNSLFDEIAFSIDKINASKLYKNKTKYSPMKKMYRQKTLPCFKNNTVFFPREYNLNAVYFLN